ncbi:CCHC-type domain-containing protein [Trichonephila inaurata madagascariensis]|uniref:CCHC-type domain-containing protein n=1 Tax=Trichonephila inaurata madagascariensis TaxID=2747483 RepID=A0A8X6XXX8_9ARAC|nr:CCHC-type domain-containing protein [Trichonephila inaurata madagascariensis]
MGHNAAPEGDTKKELNGNTIITQNDSKKTALPKKLYTHRNSVLTDLMEVNHLQTVYNISVAIFVLLLINLTIYYIALPETYLLYSKNLRDIIGGGAGSTVAECRRSRRLQGLSPELGLLVSPTRGTSPKDMSQDSECQTFPIFPLVQPGTTRLWYENKEEDLSSWEKFQDQLKIAFGSTELFIKQAESELKNRAQKTDFIKECQRIEEMNQRRIAKHRFTRLSNVVPVASIGEHEGLVTLIRHIVREEVQRMSVAVNRRNEPPRRPRKYATVVRQPRRPIEPLPVPRQTDVWRTEDYRPVCFHCGRPGHVVHYCRERRAIFDAYRSRQATNSQPPSPNLSPDECSRLAIRIPSPIPSRGRSPVRRYRSPSPYIRRSPSRSPIRRDEEN